MYGIVDRPLRKPKALRSPIPTYDVKIIAGRRVVIFHDNKLVPKDFCVIQALQLGGTLLYIASIAKGHLNLHVQKDIFRENLSFDLT